MQHKLDQYQELCLQTVSPIAGEKPRDLLASSAVGLANEWGEFIQLLEQYLTKASPILPTKEKIEDEFGDVLWYFAVLSYAVSIDFSTVINMQVEYRNTNSTRVKSLVDKCLKVSMHIGLSIGGIKKYLWHGHEFPEKETLVKKFRLLGWHLAVVATLCNISIEEVLDKNIQKLSERYPNGFEVERSINRKEG